jgi:ribosomal protein L29
MTQEERDKEVKEMLQLLAGLSVEKSTKIADAFDRKDREIAELKAEIDRLKIELSNYAYQIDMAKRERGQAEVKLFELEKQFRNGC